MSRQQGNKKYYQILLDKKRAELLEVFAGHNNQRATAWIRDAIYEKLEHECGTSIYELYRNLDEAEWKQSVQNRLEGRNKARMARNAAQLTN